MLRQGETMVETKNEGMTWRHWAMIISLFSFTVWSALPTNRIISWLLLSLGVITFIPMLVKVDKDKGMTIGVE
jgi:hypothetical protein